MVIMWSTRKRKEGAWRGAQKAAKIFTLTWIFSVTAVVWWPFQHWKTNLHSYFQNLLTACNGYYSIGFFFCHFKGETKQNRFFLIMVKCGGYLSFLGFQTWKIVLGVLGRKKERIQTVSWKRFVQCNFSQFSCITWSIEEILPLTLYVSRSDIILSQSME